MKSKFRACNRVPLLVQEKASRLDNRWLSAAGDSVVGVFCFIRAPRARLLSRFSNSPGFDPESSVLVIKKSVVCCRPVTMGSAVFGLVWRGAISVVSEGVVHIFRPVVVITAVLILVIKFHSNVRGYGLVEGPSDRSMMCAVAVWLSIWDIVRSAIGES